LGAAGKQSPAVELTLITLDCILRTHMAIPSTLTATTEQNLLDFIKAELHEGKNIEYKREIAI
jgi:hypothetical protein